MNIVVPEVMNYKWADECLGIQNLSSNVTNQIRNWELGNDLELVGAGQSCFICDALTDGSVIKVTRGEGATEFMRFMLDKKIPGLPEIYEDLGMCGFSRVYNEPLFGFRARKYSNNISPIESDDWRVPLLAQLVAPVQRSEEGNSQLSINALKLVQSVAYDEIIELDWGGAIATLIEFFTQHLEKEFVLELPSTDWFLDGDVLINIDPVAS